MIKSLDDMEHEKLVEAGIEEKVFNDDTGEIMFRLKE